MTVIVTCDYCGEAIDGTHAKIQVVGHFPRPDGPARYSAFDLGHFCTEARDDGRLPCFWMVKDAVEFVQDTGPSLERIPTISGQAVAARRRKHTRTKGE